VHSELEIGGFYEHIAAEFEALANDMRSCRTTCALSGFLVSAAQQIRQDAPGVALKLSRQRATPVSELKQHNS